MEERNCYLAIEKIMVDNDDPFFSVDTFFKIQEFLLKRHEIKLNDEGEKFVKYVIGEMLEGRANGLTLDMLELTYEEAQSDVCYLNERGIFSSIQYRETNNTSIQNTSIQNTSIQKIDTKDVDFMKQYLKDLYTLEKNLYCSEQINKKYDNIINSLGKSSIDTNQEFYGKFKYKIDVKAIIGRGVFYGIGGALLFGFFGQFFECLVPAAIIGFKLVFLFGAFMGWWDENDIKQKSEKEYQHRQEDNKRIEDELKQTKTYIDKRAPFIQNVHSCNEALKQLYSLDIIFPKYRNFVAISQIYEYYMSGRCTELEGHEGAYNIFESEVRQNIIILQLNNVLNQLEQIKQNQYMIYQALQEANSRLAQIESNTQAIAYNTSVIAENSAICARYAQSGGNRRY